MSTWVCCSRCGDLMEVPSYEGDGAYHVHVCKELNECSPVASQYAPATEEPEEEA